LPAGEDFFISCQNTDFESQLAGHESRQEGWYFLWKWKWEWRLKRLIETKQKLEKERKGLIISNIILGGLVVLLGAIMAFQHGKNKNQRTKKSDENPTEY
jgi:phosphate/sulfate permease